MADKNEVTLRVQEAYHRDVGRGIARIDMETMRQLGMVSGDIIEIEGKGAIATAVVWPGYPSEEGKGVILIDGNIRSNARVGIDDRVKVRKIQAKKAERITLAPTQPVRITGGEYYLLKLLEGRPISKGQAIRVEMLGSPMTFVVTNTRPAGTVIADMSTEVTISEKPVEAEKAEKTPHISYEDIGGLRREIGLVREMIELPLRHPELFQKLGIEPPKGVLLFGPPGTGKTMIAKAVASETDAHFINISGPEIMSKYYGESEKQLRDIFKEAEDNAPSIIFIDEIDSIAPKREEVTGEVERRVVAQLLSLMDGLQSRGQVVVVAATNRPNAVDPALRRGGRFDREIEIGVPDKVGRLEILHVHTRGMPLKTLNSVITRYLSTVLDVKDLSDIIERSRLNELLGKQQFIEELTEASTLRGDDIPAVQKKLTNVLEHASDSAYKESGEAATVTELKRKLLDALFQVMTKKDEQQFAKDDVDYLQKNIPLIERATKQKIRMEEVRESDLLNNPSFIKSVLKGLGAGSDSVDKMSIKELHLKLFEELDKIKQKENEKNKTNFVNLERLADTTYGFVGADIAALCKEAAMHALRMIMPSIDIEKEIPQEVLDELQITGDDFTEALKNIEPSAMREVFVEVPDVHWSDVGGLDMVKQELRESVEWPLKFKEVFSATNTTPPKGIMMFGPPGTGKTLLAKAVANESEANFISIKGPEILNKYVGESEKAIRETFRKARQSAPTIIFFDEIDAIAPTRGAGFDSHVTERVVSQMLTELDGLEELHNVVVIAATNRPDMVDTALLRPGRLDRLLYIPPPEEESRLQIYRIHTRGKPLDRDVDLEKIARDSKDYVGADIEAVCREAAMLAIREHITHGMTPEQAKKEAGNIKIKMKHFEAALQKVRPTLSRDMHQRYEKLTAEFARQVVGTGETAPKKEKKEEKKPAEIRTAS
ncbi:CDC48 family AAA ATPase [Methanocella arvoryzae]|uniref:Cell division cycle protein 48 n=1 Tax=Methanocella arvoryzae (strain DSM 22066 / NBRC 105507 / MRE50) TaxID=351160 RepID=Q0W6B6_METAR|nr:CDC48 family AAA ATPase [Methanocella arvoryzae]CAJ36077.1 putative cell division cycle protein 48 [Methanocella arvoryzae MRE50]